jgi:hypothetical protein
MSKKDGQSEILSSSPKQDPSDRTPNVVEDNSMDLKRQLKELAQQIADIATRISHIESKSIGSDNRKRSKDKSKGTVYLKKKWRIFIEQWRTSPDEQTKDLLENCLRWLGENITAIQNHQNTLQNSLAS